MSLVSQRRTLSASASSLAPTLGGLTFWAGFVMLTLAAGFAIHSWWAVRNYGRAEATVTENVATQDEKGNVVYTSHLHFQLPGGRIVSFADPVTSDDSDSPTFAAGRVVPVIFPAVNPQAAYVATEWRIYSAANWLGILGVVLVDLGLILRRLGKKTQS